MTAMLPSQQTHTHAAWGNAYSFVDNSARRLLTDRASNPGFLAGAAKIDLTGIPLIEMASNKLGDEANLVTITPFSACETAEAYKLYSQHLQVTIPEEHEKSNDPYLVGSAMRMHSGGQLPVTLEEPNITQFTLVRKLQRIERTLGLNATEILKQIGSELFKSGDVVQESSVSMACGMPPVAAFDPLWCEVGLLTIRRSGSSRWIDFYYSRERDFVISNWCREWNHVLGDPNLVCTELRDIACSRIAMDSLRWFLRQTDSITYLIVCAGRFGQCETKVKVIILSAISITVSRGCEEFDWIRQCVDLALRDPESMVRVEAVRILAMLASEREEITDHITDDIELIRGLLRLDSDFPLRPMAGGQIVLDAFSSLHCEQVCGEEDESSFTEILERIIEGDNSSDRRAAAEALAYISPTRYCQVASEYIIANIEESLLEDILVGLGNAASQLGEHYYGSYCPGYFEVLNDDPEARLYEWNLMKERLWHIMRIGGQRVEFFRSLFYSLQPDVDSMTDVQSEVIDHPDQLKLPFI